MRIISRFQDYYDRSQAHGADQTRVFLRETKEYNDGQKNQEVPAHLTQLTSLLKGDMSSGRVSLSPFLVAFAGKLYPGVRCHVLGSAADNPPSQSKAEIVYDINGLLRFCTAYEVDLDKKGMFDRRSQAQRFKAFFELAGSDRCGAMLAEHSIAIAVATAGRPRCVMVNPPLKTFEFFKVFDAWQTYQELDMYLGALAAPDTKPPVQVADADRIHQHGFDRQSFRTRPQNK
jgi:hypothetical protein